MLSWKFQVLSIILIGVIVWLGFSSIEHIEDAYEIVCAEKHNCRSISDSAFFVKMVILLAAGGSVAIAYLLSNEKL
jgi:hypothetical protein